MTIILLILLLGVIIYQDSSQRAISVWTIPLLYILGVAINYQFNELKLGLLSFIQNSLFIIFQLLVLTLYFSWKEKKRVNVIDRWLGLGDILFFFGIGLLFSPVNFIAFFIGSIFLVLVFFLFIKILFKNILTIPLAGGMAIPLILIYVVVFLKKNSFYILYHDEYLLQWLVNNTNIY